MASPHVAPLPKDRPLNAIIVGGSITGLLVGLMLKRNGHTVTILEQTPHELEHQAAGVGAGPTFSSLLQRYDRNTRPSSLPIKGVSTVDSTDSVKGFIPVKLALNSWDAIYYRLRWNFDGLQNEYYPDPPEHATAAEDGEARYWKGHQVTDIEVSEDGAVTAHFLDVTSNRSGKITGDLLIGADGASSTVRQKIFGDVPREYAGYVLFRGVVDETNVSEKTREFFEGRITSLVLRNQYVIAYHIPGRNGSLIPGSRLLNCAWWTRAAPGELASILTDRQDYQHHWSVPLGKLSDSIWSWQKSRGRGLLSPHFSELLNALDKPFVQVITDLATPRAVNGRGGRVLLLGDAYRLLRPHTGKSIGTAAEEVLLLERALRGEMGWDEWEREVEDLCWVNALESVSWGGYYMYGGWYWLWTKLKYMAVVGWLGWRKWLFGRG